MAIDAQTYLVAFAAIILIAFGGHVIFQRTKMPDVVMLIFLGALLGQTGPKSPPRKMPDVVMLIFLGALLGPVWPNLPGVDSPVLDPEIFRQLMPLLGTVAIIIILFDGGLKLQLKDLFVGLAPATLLTVLGFIASMLMAAGILWQFGQVNWILTGLIFGAIVGGTSSVVVMPIVERMTIERRTQTVVGLESALTDVLVVVVAISLSIAHAAAAVSPQSIAQDVAAKFAIGILIGSLSGIVWARYLRAFTQRSYEYMLTLALLFIVYAVTEFLNGSGPLAVLAFGLAVGNSHKRDRLTGADLRKAKAQHSSRHKLVPVFNLDLVNLHNEIVFFVRAFFFVALGVILDLNVIFNPKFLLISLVIVAGLVAARLWALTLTFWRADLPAREKTAIAFLMARGLAAAALAAVPFTTYGIRDVHPRTCPDPMACQPAATVDSFVAFAVVILLLTNIITSVAVYLFENQRFQDWLGGLRARSGA